MGFMDALAGEAISPTSGAKPGTIGGDTVDAASGLQRTNARGLLATLRRNKITEEALKHDNNLLKSLKVAELERNAYVENIFSTGKKEGAAEQKKVAVAAGANAAIGMENVVSSIVRRKNEYHRQIFNLQKQMDATSAVVAAAGAVATGIAEHWPKDDPTQNKPIYTDDPSVVKFMRDLQAETAATDQSRRAIAGQRWGAGMGVVGKGTGDVQIGDPLSERAAFMAQNREWTRAEKARDAEKRYIPRTTGGVQGMIKREPAHAYGEGADLSSLFLSGDTMYSPEPMGGWDESRAGSTNPAGARGNKAWWKKYPNAHRMIGGLDPYPDVGVYDQGGFWDPEQ